MGLLPKPEDMRPRETRFYCPGEDGGISRTVSRGTPEAVEERLRSDFPLYRAKKVGVAIVKRLVNGGSGEV